MIRLLWSCFFSGIFFIPLCVLFYASIILGFGWIKIKKIRIVNWIGMGTARSFLFFSGVSVRIKIAPGMSFDNLVHHKNILACNHASSFDTFVLQGMFPYPVQFIAKREILMIPLFGWGLYLLGCIPINRSNRKQSLHHLQQVTHKLRNGSYTAIFPEGTRTDDGTVQPFRSGVIRMCQERDDVAIIPVGIIGSYQVLSKNSWQLQPGIITLHLGSPLFRKDFPTDPTKGAEILKEHVQQLCKNPV